MNFTPRQILLEKPNQRKQGGWGFILTGPGFKLRHQDRKSWKASVLPIKSKDTATSRPRQLSFKPPSTTIHDLPAIRHYKVLRTDSQIKPPNYSCWWITSPRNPKRIMNEHSPYNLLLYCTHRLNSETVFPAWRKGRIMQRIFIQWKVRNQNSIKVLPPSERFTSHDTST